MKRGTPARGGRWWRGICLADRLLLLFMGILLLQAGHNLFVHELARGQSTELDVVVRTTAASIFGYFVSAGVRGGERTGAGTTRNRIGFSLPRESSLRMEEESPPAGPAYSAAAPETGGEERESRLGKQMVIVGGIGLASLILLILARNCGQTSPEALATLSQLRDFVSGSVGFLIGHGGGREQT